MKLVSLAYLQQPVPFRSRFQNHYWASLCEKKIHLETRDEKRGGGGEKGFGRILEESLFFSLSFSYIYICFSFYCYFEIVRRSGVAVGMNTPPPPKHDPVATSACNMNLPELDKFPPGRPFADVRKHTTSQGYRVDTGD